jgi:hypothetical protein
MDPPLIVPAANLLKSGEAVIPTHNPFPAPARLFHVTPPSAERYMPPLRTAAASFVKSGVEIILSQILSPATF